MLAILGPAAFALAVDPLSGRQAASACSAGLALGLIAVALWIWSGDREAASRNALWEPVIAQMRAAAARLDQLQRRVGEFDQFGQELQVIKLVLNGERHNLSLVAAGLAELRQTVDTERSNLGRTAEGVHDIRAGMLEIRARSDEVFGQVTEFAEMMDAAHAHLGALSNAIDDMGLRLGQQQKNLGMVAGGLDGLRRSMVGVETFNARQAAFADMLVEIADRVDGLSSTGTGPGHETRGV